MKKFLPPLVVFVGSLAYYVDQACPTFYFWDSAELTAAVLGNGVPHPPGFPALLLLAKLWVAVIPADPAYSLNLLSAFFASLGLTFWFLLARIIFRRLFSGWSSIEIDILSLIAAIILGISFSFSIQAVRFEVYAFNFACFAIMMYLAFKLILENGKYNSALLILLILVSITALGGHHFTIALAIPGILLLLYLHRRMKLVHLLYFPAFAILLLLPMYYYIFFLAQNNPVLSWGAPSSWAGFRDYFFLKEFSTPASSFAPSHLAKNLAFAVEVIVKQTGILGFILGLWGIIRLVRTHPKLATPLLTILVLNIFSLIFFEDYFYDNYDQHGYLLFSIALFALFAAMTVGLIGEYLLAHLKPKIMANSARYKAIVIIVPAVIVLFAPIKDNLFSANLSRLTAARDFAGLFMEKLPENAVLVSSSYNTYFCLLAYNASRNPASDVFITNVYNWDHDWGRRHTASLLGIDYKGISRRPDFYRNLLNRLREDRPIYVEFDKASAPLAKYLKPSGLSYKFSISDTSATNLSSIIAELEDYREVARKSQNIESLRTWVLWFVNRGQYYSARERNDVADMYLDAAEKVGSLADLN